MKTALYRFLCNKRQQSYTESYPVTGHMRSIVTGHCNILRQQRKLCEFCFKGGSSTNLKLSKGVLLSSSIFETMSPSFGTTR